MKKLLLLQLECAQNAGKTGSELIPAYVSLAQTYFDDKQFELAIEFYRKELELRHDNPAQVKKLDSADFPPSPPSATFQNVPLV